MSNIRVVHYINQFYAGIGGEEKADYPLELRKGEVIGPGMAFRAAFGNSAEIIATIICGDVYFAEHVGEVKEKILGWIQELNPDVVVAGPAFNAGRYGMAAGTICDAVQSYLNIPAFTGMYEENPGVEMYKNDICIFPTKNSAAGMKDAIALMAPFALKLGRHETIFSADVEGYMPKGCIPSPTTKICTDLYGLWGTRSACADNRKVYDSSAPVLQPKATVRKTQPTYRSNLIIKTTNFNSALNKIADFANSSVTPIKFKSVEEDGFFFERDVTGREFNRFLKKELLPQLETIQDNQQKTIREFSSVYRTFDSLDKDYIAGIIHAVQSAEKASYQAVEASDQAKDASDEALRASSNVAQAQQDIRKTVEALGATVEKLCEFEAKFARFKDRLENSDHLYDIDKLWEYVIEIQTECENIKGLELAVKGLHAFEEEINRFKGRIEKYDHIYDIDKLWEYVLEIRTERDELRKSLPATTENGQIQNSTMAQKLKIAYAIAGTAVGISILHIILRVAGVF